MSNLSFHPEFGRAFKYQFDVQLHSLDMEIPFPCYIEISWRRKNKSISTKQKFEVKGNQKQFKFSQKLSMISTCYYDPNMLSFKDKNSVITLIIYINNVPKSGGQITLNLTSILNPTNIKEVFSKTMTCALDKCPIKNSSLTFTLEGCYLQQMQQDVHNRSISMTSEISSLYAKSFTDSNFSLNFGKQPPSKDCSASVRDITNMLKMDSRVDMSNKKRSDSVSCYGPTQNSISEQVNLESKKSLGLKSHVSQGKNNISEYMLPPKKDDKLREQKYRLQAENTQLKIYNQQQNSKLNQQIKQISQLKSQLQNYSNHSSILRSQVGKLQGELHFKQMKESQLQIKLSDTSSLQKHIAELQHELTELKQNFDQSKFDNQILKQECESMNKHIFSIETQRNNHKSQAEQLLNKLKQKQSLLQSNRQQIERFYNEKNEYLKSRYEYESKIRQYQGQIQYVNNQRNKERSISLQKASSSKQLQHSLSILSQRIKCLEIEAKNKQSRISQLQHSDVIQRGNLQSLQNIKNNLQRQLQYSSEDLNKKNQNIDVLMNIKSKHQHQIMILTKQMEQYKNKESEISKLKQKLIKQQQDIKMAKDNETRNTQSISIFKDNNSKLQQELSSKINAMEMLRQEIQTLRDKIQQLNQQIQSQKRSINTQQSSENLKNIQELQHKVQRADSQKLAVQKAYDELLEANIQLQIQTKMLSSTNSSIKNQQVEQLKRQIIVQKSNLTQCQQQISILQKQLKQKTRNLAIQIQKSKMYSEQNQTLQQTLIQRNTHLDIEKQKCEVLESNIRNVEQRNDEIMNENRLLKQKIQILQLSLQSIRKQCKNTKQYEIRINELQSKQSDRIAILEQQKIALSQSHNIIKDLNIKVQSLYLELSNKDKLIKEIESKMVSNQQLKKKNNELCTLASENRNLCKKNELLFKQICQLKQQVQLSQQDKNNQNNGQLLQKIQTMQNQLTKRQDKIKKLEKENTKLQQQNIQLNIKIMKELSELHKKQEGIKSEYSKTLNKVLSQSHS